MRTSDFIHTYLVKHQSVNQRARRFLRANGIEVTGYRHSVMARRQTLLEYLNVDFLVDVGANVGQAGLSYRCAGFQGTIVSFEPDSRAFRRLQEQAAGDKKWNLRHSAVGDRSGEIVMHLSEESQFNSALQVSDRTIDNSPYAQVVDTEIAEMTTLDQIVSQIPADATVGVKIDVQGFENEVLNGGSAAISRAVYLDIEMEPVPMYTDQVLLPEMVQRLDDTGLTVCLTENAYGDYSTGQALSINFIYGRM